MIGGGGGGGVVGSGGGMGMGAGDRCGERQWPRRTGPEAGVIATGAPFKTPVCGIGPCAPPPPRLSLWVVRGRAAKTVRCYRIKPAPPPTPFTPTSTGDNHPPPPQSAPGGFLSLDGDPPPPQPC